MSGCIAESVSVLPSAATYVVVVWLVCYSDDTLAGVWRVSGARNSRQELAPVSGQCVMAFILMNEMTFAVPLCNIVSTGAEFLEVNLWPNQCLKIEGRYGSYMAYWHFLGRLESTPHRHFFSEIVTTKQNTSTILALQRTLAV